MMKIFENNSIFYAKTLALYGALLAVLYYPSMQQEQNDANYKFAVAADTLTYNNGTNSAEDLTLYNFGKHISLIKRSQVIEAEFHRNTDSFVHGAKKLEEMKSLLAELKEEKGRFSNYLVTLSYQQKGGDKAKHSRKMTWKKNKYLSQHANLESVQRQRRAMRYHSEVLRHAIKTLKFMVGRIEKAQTKELTESFL